MSNQSYHQHDIDDELEDIAVDLAALNTTDRRIYDAQTRFLAEYVKVGTIKSASTAADISRETVRRWQRADKLGFSDRFKSAQETFRETLEEIMFERLRDPKTHPVLLIFALKAHWREKYGDVPEVDDTTAQETLAELRKLGRRAHQRPEAQGAQQTHPNGSQPWA